MYANALNFLDLFYIIHLTDFQIQMCIKDSIQCPHQRAGTQCIESMGVVDKNTKVLKMIVF